MAFRFINGDELENNYTVGRDQELHYIVMKFNKSQMDAFIKSAEEKRWKFGAAILFRY
ncbi:MAG: hypothetical protein QJR05_00770 [Thermoanaerobacterium sp.]|nr:hypothetical protein [Thermoanaerobacterium sp.]